tara:strand:+ start:84135 stop:84887 length:753 start_codon:yes stop_codon:yes gene_type:complete
LKILLSNDDGYKSKGIKILYNLLKSYGNVIVSAPHKDVSACSSYLSVNKNIRVKKLQKNYYVIFGTPADSVHIVTRGILKKLPDIVFSGINFGENMGDDVIYSGTVAAALEGRFCNYASVAVSIASKNPKYLSDITLKITPILNLFFQKLYKYNNIFNINIPDLPFNKIKGIKFTKLGRRNIPKRSKKYHKINDCVYYDIGDVGNEKIIKGATDFNVVRSGYISITPLSIDMSDKEILNKLKKKYDKFYK